MYVAVDFNGWDDVIEAVYGPFETSQAAAEWIDEHHEGKGFAVVVVQQPA